MFEKGQYSRKDPKGFAIQNVQPYNQNKYLGFVTTGFHMFKYISKDKQLLGVTEGTPPPPPRICNKCRVLTPGTCLPGPVKLFSRRGQRPPAGVSHPPTGAAGSRAPCPPG